MSQISKGPNSNSYSAIKVGLGCAFLFFGYLMSGARAQRSPFEDAIHKADVALNEKNASGAKSFIDRAVERDAKSREVWALWERWGQLANDKDEMVYALHRQYRLAVAQNAPRAEVKVLLERLRTVDPIAPELLDLKTYFIEKLLPIAEHYEAQRRPHSAIRVHQEILSLDPEFEASKLSIERISAAPDPSLAETAKPKDLLEDISEDFIIKFDAKHATWDKRAKLERENYTTYTNAGYEVMVRAAEAMEQMNAFYRVFFAYGAAEDGRTVPRIDLRIFKTRDEYLEFGSNPVEWSGGQFTGSAVELPVGGGGFSGATTTLFHEAAHQFVSLATSAAGWLNEGLASFFEGCQITANGTVLMNMPANHRLFPLADRMASGWMEDASEGIDSGVPTTVPVKAPRFGTILRNQYRWGPPWYAPTWGVVFFLYNYQDHRDGRFIYREAFRTFIDESGYRSGEGAVALFEDVVLGHPSRGTPGVDLTQYEGEVVFPRNVLDLDDLWKEWILDLRDEQVGRREVSRPYLTWAKHAITRRHFDDAAEFFEKGLVADPQNVDMLIDFADFLAERKRNTDRASKLVIQAIRILEREGDVDEAKLEKADALLAKWDPKHREITKIHAKLFADSVGIARNYLDSGFPKMAMDVSWRLGTELGVPGIFEIFEEAVRSSGKTLALWELAYNEQDLAGWNSNGQSVFKSEGVFLTGEFGKFEPNAFEFQFLTLDRITSGDFSMEAEVFAKGTEIGFCGLVFGQKDSSNFQAVILFPGQAADEKYNKKARSAFVDLSTFYGESQFQIWRHHAVAETQSKSHRIRIDVTGLIVDVWVDGQYLTTQEFANRDVLRGSFGLITGPGQSQYREIRFLARPSLDIGASIERDVRMEKITGGGSTADKDGPPSSVNGSWIGKVPAWPEHVDWIQGQRENWGDRGPVPQVVAFWSIAQNKSIPINTWLMDLEDRYQDVGLEVLSVATFEDKSAMEKYLIASPFPGTVAVDQRRKTAFGEAFEAYSIERFGMPRVLLLDINKKVIWEGDPGFAGGSSWNPGESTYLDTPLDDLIVRRGLREVRDWANRWESEGKVALASGDIAKAAALMLEAEAFEPILHPSVEEVRTALDRTRNRIRDVRGLIDDLEANEAEAAAPVLNSWFEAFEITLDRELSVALKSAGASDRGKAWKRVLSQVSRAEKRLKPGTEDKVISDLLESITRMDGKLPEDYANEVQMALTNGDFEALTQVLANAEGYPTRWFTSVYLGW